MIVRTYGRRSRGSTGSYSAVVSDSPSQECSQDFYTFTLSSDDSGLRHLSDPYSFTSSQDSRRSKILPSRKGGECGDHNVGLPKRKKAKVIDVDSLPYGSISSQESKHYGVLEFPKPKNVKKINSTLRKCSSSQGLESSVFDFSENTDFWIPTTKNELNSSQEFQDLWSSGPRKCERKRGVSKFAGVCGKENRGLQKKKNNTRKKLSKKEVLRDVVLTTTLMETREFGEMREHVDEVNFALDGLKKGSPVRIRRASLLSLLSVGGTAQQRQLLRVNGMARNIIDAVSRLSYDDPPSNLAAAALVYLLTSDGQEDCLLDSPSCIRFLIKFLTPLTSAAAKEKAPTIGSKLLVMCKSASFSQDSAKGMDSSATAIMMKVQEILVNCKEMKSRDYISNRMQDPELNPKWISLLTMEKAFLSTISIEDTSSTVRKTGVNFKERFREFGGLDAVFEVARNCHHIIEEWLEKSPNFTLDLKDNAGLESVLLLLKCLKVMENATFLSQGNQCHLLGMKGKIDGQRAPRSFTKLILSVIKILSGVSLSTSSLRSSHDEQMCGTSNVCCNMEWTASQKSSFKSGLDSSQVSADTLLLKLRVDSSTAVSCSGTSGSSHSIIPISSDDSELEVGFGKKRLICTDIGGDNSHDPFAFHGDEFKPSKWDLLYGSADIDVDHSVLLFSQQGSSNMDREASCSSACDEEKSNLLADCLFTAVKILMNLTNDNPEGCQQIATCGGLEILSSLISGHFPSFSLHLRCFIGARENSLSPNSSPMIEQPSNTHLTDQESDFLVAILGLLVNLVEKDGHNRSRLAAAHVSLPRINGLEDQRDVISLLCSIFLANQGAGEAAADTEYFSLDDEESVLRGEKEAEKMIIEAYAALLLAFLSMESKTTRNAIAECFPDRDLAILVPVLERFAVFHLTMNMISPETHKAVLEVIESCRIP